MPSRLRPTAPVAAAAILVGDPGRALMLAQELLREPKMSNHARGLWGYTGEGVEGGRPLTIQSTGMGGPSAAIVLSDLAKLGLRRAVRVGTCVGLEGARLGEVLVARRAIALDGASRSLGAGEGASVLPDEPLREALEAALGGRARAAAVSSHDEMRPAAPGEEADAADLQTAAVLAGARFLDVAAAAVLVVSEASGGERLADEPLAEATTSAARAAARVLSTST